MGQRLGKAVFIPAVRPYLNANKACMEAAWNNFNEVAEGFGLNQEEFRRVLDVPGFRATRADADKVFEAFDTDENNLVDALEFLTTFALTSAMTLEEKVQYTFRCYDFDESGELTVDEMTLSMKSTLTGLAKMTGSVAPDDLELEDIAQAAFERADKDGDNKISYVEYQEYCFFNPEVKSWIQFFDDPAEVRGAGGRGARYFFATAPSPRARACMCLCARRRTSKAAAARFRMTWRLTACSGSGLRRRSAQTTRTARTWRLRSRRRAPATSSWPSSPGSGR